MRMLRFAAVAVLFAIPVMVAATPAAYAASTDPTDPATDSASTSIAWATPSTASPGEKVTFTVDCAAGMNPGAASAILDGSTLGLAPQIPMNPVNGSLTDFNITVMLPRSIQAGAYDPQITCPGGAPSANADLVVTRVP
jgi:hypothetical protein